MSLVDVARNASEDARCICLQEYGSAPEINIYGDPSFTFPYAPTHLHLMVFELVKNSLRAVQEWYMDSDNVSPPVRIIVANGIENVTIKVFAKHFKSYMPLGKVLLLIYVINNAKHPHFI
ncbi:hypothetical protein GIB67_038552 [Kingdonia uniflora]|uniref:Protein-serine/threonine kinase n=1 Tax=Kingdonia uniflora TaxID=39325 RepID=A0A7J7NPE1_9MAGN|nr:hypothetical protein GIB67_038552 [Kingdonia uniflora]